ncbi:MAG: ROK family protein [Vicinamibacterales bacterium]|nr:ROK family protein [Vicinamibacterales bacterium]MDP6607593.1 ROK family protein [Vicinamibacterales bacterium]
MSEVRIGVDLGGTKIEVIALAPDGATLVRTRVPTPRDDYDATLQAIVDLVASVEREIGARGTVGLGIPGAISPATGYVKNSNSIWLNGRPLAEDLAARLDRPLRFDNDANCFALSEATDGGGAGARAVFGVILGTGTGGGVIIDGRPLVGANAIGGEWGHNPLPWPAPDELPGPPCYCGRTGCLETFLSGPGLSRDYAAASGSARPAQDVAQLADHGDPAARAALDRHADRLARGLATVINLVDPDVVVLGGGLSNLDSLYTRVPELWTPYVFSDRVDTRLVRPVHGDSSGVRGAAWLWAPTV